MPGMEPYFQLSLIPLKKITHFEQIFIMLVVCVCVRMYVCVYVYLCVRVCV